jgi:plasmid stabilization system protein ParE
MRVVFTPEADGHADAMDAWWREHRPTAADLFARELAETVLILGDFPTLGTRYQARSGRELRRLLLPKTKNHVYFEVHPEQQLVTIHAVWGAPRGRGPNL